MNKNTIKGLLIAPLVFGILSVHVEAQAASPQAEYETKMDLSLEKRTGVVDPLDPEDPTKPLEPTKPGTSGALSIDHISDVMFGTHKRSKKNTIYYAELSQMVQKRDGKKIEVPNYVQVTDDRGNNKGWQLNVRMASQLKNGNHILEGAQLKLKNMKLISPSHGIRPIANKLIELNPVSLDSSSVVTAGENQGTGTWVAAFGGSKKDGKTSIQLTVPGKTKKYDGNYTTTLIWELVDSPS
ncbi:WxL domain-containing protein [Listeria rustica]|uniref:WxL domain-containing protein n=1 Tax=Listeria rustica TaxID=2713503 RepID=A0A7W1T903_9LIST|nr:WxL domain-containing protein [Listeria rustica]MBA3927712.1 WxL domain-containing protein [Listeria rustica]